MPFKWCFEALKLVPTKTLLLKYYDRLQGQGCINYMKEFPRNSICNHKVQMVVQHGGLPKPLLVGVYPFHVYDVRSQSLPKCVGMLARRCYQQSLKL